MLSRPILRIQQSRGYAAILTTTDVSNTVIVGNVALDITQEVVEGLNAEYIKVETKLDYTGQYIAVSAQYNRLTDAAIFINRPLLIYYECNNTNCI